MTPRVRRWLSVTVTALGIGASALTCLSVVRGRYYAKLGRAYAAWTIGEVASGYISTNGAPPRDVDTLFACGLLRYDESPQSGRSWVTRSDGKGQAFPAKHTKEIHLLFPGSTDAYLLVGDTVINRDTDERLIIVTCDGGLPPSMYPHETNRLLAREWYLAMSASEDKK